MKRVLLTIYPNIAPAGTSVTRTGEGSNLALAVYRALKEALKADKVRGKRIKLPMRMVAMDCESNDE